MSRPILAGLVLLAVVTTAGQAQRKSPFCQGFEEGWNTGQGGGLVPICPIEPITPIGSTSFREGIKAGLRAAQQKGSRSRLPSNTRERGDFCEGFEEGWKTIKGDLTIVPICPIEPITPIGSTSYREGLKAGMAKARSR